MIEEFGLVDPWYELNTRRLPYNSIFNITITAANKKRIVREIKLSSSTSYTKKY
jgi:hypothetical protein